MTAYVLVLVFTYCGYSSDMKIIEGFKSKQACENAGNTYVQDLDKYSHNQCQHGNAGFSCLSMNDK